MLDVHAQDGDTGVSNTAWHSDRRIYLVLQARMVARVKTLAQQPQTGQQFLLTLHDMYLAKSNDAAEIGGILIGVNIILRNDRERTFFRQRGY